jgi:hypothetical protein
MEHKVLGQEFSSWLWAQAGGKETEEGRPESLLAGFRVPLSMRGDRVGGLWHLLLNPKTLEELMLA